MSDDTRDPIAEAFDRIEARLIGGSIFLSHSQADDLATLRAALEQRKPTLPDSELLGESVDLVRTACETIDDEGSIPSRPCTTFTDALDRIIAALEQADRRARDVEEAARALIQRHGPKAHLDGCECAWCVLGRATLGGDARQAPRCIIDETTFCQPESCGNTSCREQRHTGGEG